MAVHAESSEIVVIGINAGISAFCDNKSILVSPSLHIMKKWLYLCVFLIATPVFAENWVQYAEVSEASRYYDKFRMVNMSGNAFIWDLHDLRKPVTDASGKAYQSVLYPTEFSCRKHQRRILSVHKMSAGMGEGMLITEHSVVGEWIDVLPESPDDHLMRAVCASQ